jgi:hypothetical protein
LDLRDLKDNIDGLRIKYKWNMGFWRENYRFYGLRTEHRWTQDGIWREHRDFEETILDLIDLKNNLDGIWMECGILDTQLWILWT